MRQITSHITVALLLAMTFSCPARAGSCTTEQILSYGTLGLSADAIDKLCNPEQAALVPDSLGPEPVAVSEGVLEVFTQAERIAPLKITTPSGGGNHYVKIIDASNFEPVMTAYIESGSTLELRVPLGIYRIRYAIGDTWYGSELKFGENTVYAEADDTFNFEIDGNRILGHRLELIKQEGGNLSTKSLSAADF